MWSLPIDESTRVWLYVSTRPFNQVETAAIEEELALFTKSWTAHDEQLTAFGTILLNRVMLVAVNEKLVKASGCSIDKSVHFIQDINQRYNCNFFDRELVAYQTEHQWNWTTYHEVQTLLKKGVITSDTPILDTTKTQFLSEAELVKPLKSTWLSRFLSQPS